MNILSLGASTQEAAADRAERIARSQTVEAVSTITNIPNISSDVLVETFGDPALYPPGPVGASGPPNHDVAYRLEKKDVKVAIADEAKNIVAGARRAAYGKPEQNFERIARFWQAYFENTGRGAVKITAQDVSPLMRLMKEARLAETPDHRDSFVDLVGYTLTGAEVNGVKA